MCGIAGFLSFASVPPSDPERLRRMTRTLTHRGPDDEGVVCFSPRPGCSAGLGHRRLSILDLSPAGRNPLANEDDSVWITFNGEIYNHLDHRATLERRGHRYRSRTDTETLVHLYEERADALVEDLRGMFAFALLDLRRERVLLARDRLGKKPLFWCAPPGAQTIFFASEVKALLSALDRRPEISPDGVDQLLAFGYVPAPDTLWNGIHALPPGHTLTFDATGVPRQSCYWTPAQFRTPGAPAATSDLDWERGFQERFETAVRLRMVADVPVGAFLSGGIDSSLVVAAMARQSSRPIRTYSIGFDDPRWDEREPARRVARHFGTEHREWVVRPTDVGETLALLAHHADEGFADSSMLPTWFVSKLAREDVTVALSGDGGDELFAGYTHYLGESVARSLGKLPLSLRALLPGFADALARVPGLPGRRRFRHAARVLRDGGADMAQRFYLKRCLLRDRERVPLYRPEFAARLTGRARAAVQACHHEVAGVRDFVRRLAIMDLLFYLPNDMLMKVDHASMACGLEVRTPFLDHPLVEYCMALPTRLKLRGWTSKVLLRTLAGRLLPAGIAGRRKQGFGVPVATWFRGDLLAFARGHLLGPGARSPELLRGEAVRSLIDRHAAGTAEFGQGLWALLCLESWLREFA